MFTCSLINARFLIHCFFKKFVLANFEACLEANQMHKSASAPQLTAEAPKKVGKYEKDDNWKPESVKKGPALEKKPALKIYSSESEEELKVPASPKSERKAKHSSHQAFFFYNAFPMTKLSD